MKEKPYVIKKQNIRLVSEPADNYQWVSITSSSDIHDFAREHLYDSDIAIYESVFIVMLNRANDTIGFVKTGMGGVHSSIMDPRIIVKYAVEFMASSIILIHNHPSGNLKPSNPDISITRKIKEGLTCFDIDLLDHIIMTPESGRYLSFADEGML